MRTNGKRFALEDRESMPPTTDSPAQRASQSWVPAAISCVAAVAAALFVSYNSIVVEPRIRASTIDMQEAAKENQRHENAIKAMEDAHKMMLAQEADILLSQRESLRAAEKLLKTLKGK